MRPSPGAAAWGGRWAPEFSQTLVRADIAAPGNGRTSLNTCIENELPPSCLGGGFRGGFSASCGFSEALEDGGLGGGQARHRDTKWRATDVRESDFVTERDTVGIPTVFSANPEFDIRTGFAPAVDGDFHQFPHAGLIDAGERVLSDDLEFLVGWEE